MRLLGIDYGTKRIGVALSDSEGKFALPHSVISNGFQAVGEIAKLCREKEVRGIVMGESRDFSGAPNPIHEQAAAFARELGKLTGLAVHFEPEFFTSAEAERMPGRQARNPARKTAAVKNENLDASAAALILKSFIDKQNQK